MASPGRSAIPLLFFVSGAAGLVYQVVWMRKLVLILGATSQAVGTVLAVFMGGLALGAWLLGRRADRARSPLALYGSLEIGIALLGAASAFLLDALVPAYASLRRSLDPSPQTLAAVRVVLAAAVLLVPTTLMGATLPVLVRAAHGADDRVGRRVGVLYAVNTLGAAAGAILAGFLLIETLGLRATIFAAAAANAAVGLGAWALARGAARSPAAARTAPPPAPASDPALARTVLAVFGVSGFAALAFEVLWTRALVYVVGHNSTYAFSSMLAAFLLGLVLGSALSAAIADRRRDPQALLGAVLVLFGASALGAFALLGVLLRERRIAGDGETWLAVTTVDFARCLAVLVVPTTLSGATFPLVARLYATRPERLGGDVGRAYAVNTLGAIAGALAGSFVVLPWLGLRLGTAALALLPIAAGAVILLRARPEGRAVRTAAVTLALAAAAFVSVLALGDPHRRILERGAHEVLFHEDGPESTVAVVRSEATGGVQLYVDGDAQASTEPRTQIHLRLLGHLPALFHRSPREALVVGFGGGITTGCLAQHPLERLDLVEISGAVDRWAKHWERFNHDPLHDPKVHLVRDDGRNFLLGSDRLYDVITSDPIDPDDAGVTSLYSKEYYELVRDHLREGGVAAQWMTAQYDPDVYRMLVRTFQSVFPHTTVWFAYYTTVLIGMKDGPGATMTSLRERMSDPRVRESLAAIGIEEPEAMVSLLFAGPDQVRRLVGPGPLNTDDRPLVEYRGPRWSGLGEETGGIAADFAELGVPSWRDVLARWSDDDASRIDRSFGWVQRLLARDMVDLRVDAVDPARVDDRLWLETAAERDALAVRYLDLTWEILASSVPRMVLLMTGFPRVEPPPDAPSSTREAYTQGLARGLDAWRTGDYERARERFAATAAAVPGTLRPAVLAAACEHRAGSPLGALRTLLAAGYGPDEAASAAAWLPHKMVSAVLQRMAESRGAAASLGTALLELMPRDEDRAAAQGVRSRVPRPSGADVGEVSAWRLWWRSAHAAVEARDGRFVWRRRP